MSVDPLAEKYNFQSSYVYAGNNPVTMIDILGKEPGGPDDPPNESQMYYEISKEGQSIASQFFGMFDNLYASVAQIFTSPVDDKLKTKISTTVSPDFGNYIKDIQCGENGEPVMPNEPLFNTETTTEVYYEASSKISVPIERASLGGEISAKINLEDGTSSAKMKGTLGVGTKKLKGMAFIEYGINSNDQSYMKSGLEANVNINNVKTQFQIGIKLSN